MASSSSLQTTRNATPRKNLVLPALPRSLTTRKRSTPLELSEDEGTIQKEMDTTGPAVVLRAIRTVEPDNIAISQQDGKALATNEKSPQDSTTADLLQTENNVPQFMSTFSQDEHSEHQKEVSHPGQHDEGSRLAHSLDHYNNNSSSSSSNNKTVRTYNDRHEAFAELESGVQQVNGIDRSTSSYEHHLHPKPSKSSTANSIVSSMTGQAADNLTEVSDQTTTAAMSSSPTSVNEYTSGEQSKRNGASHIAPEVIANGQPTAKPPIGMANGHDRTTSGTALFPTIYDHLIHLAGTKSLTDYMIQIEQPLSNLPPYISYAHSFVLYRSDRLRRLMDNSQNPNYPSNIISLAPDRLIQPHAFEAALRFLYTDSILSIEHIFPPNVFMDKNARTHAVDYTLSYWLAGIELGLEPVAARAYDILVSMLDWDLAELLVKEALLLRTAKPAHLSSRSNPDPNTLSDMLMQLVYRLFSHRLDAANFRLDATAQAAVMPPRLSLIESGRVGSNPALAGMVFGSMPSSTITPQGSPDIVSLESNKIASAILLNLDFTSLTNLAQDLINFNGVNGVRIIIDAVTEREQQRQNMLNNSSIPNKQRMDNANVWDVVGWREYVHDGKLQRERTGYLLPRKNISQFPPLRH